MEKEINKTNFIAYNDKGRWKNKESLNLYRQQCLDNYYKCVEFVKTFIFSKKLKVVDIGSGYSSFLFSLEKEGILEKGIAVEQSIASHQFAEEWKKDWGFKNVINVNANALEFKYQEGEADLFSIIDSTFPLLYHENSSFPQEMVNIAFNSLKPKAYLLIDIINFYPLLKGGGNRKIWKEFSEGDFFKYGLYEENYDKNNNLIERKSIYIGKDLSVSEKKEVVFYYTLDLLFYVLLRNGFTVEQYFGDFKCGTFNYESSPQIIVLARKEK